MEPRHMKNTMIAGFVALLFWNISAAAEEMADTIYHNGSILTMAGEEPTYVEALAVKDGTIVYTGSKDEALAMKDDSTKDLRSRRPGHTTRLS